MPLGIHEWELPSSPSVGSYPSAKVWVVGYSGLDGPPQLAVTPSSAKGEQLVVGAMESPAGFAKS